MIDTHDIGLSVSYGNRRYQDARRGLDALAATLGKNVDDFAHVVAREMRVFIARETDKLAARHSGTTTTDKALAKRTGRLVRELQRGGVVHEAAKVADVYGEVTLPGEYRIQEYGGTITPREGQYLFVPLPAALNADGSPKKLNPRQWQHTFIAESRKGNLLLFQRLGRKVIPLYALKPQVRVRPRLGFVAQMKRGFPEFADRALEALLDALTKDLT
jgi:hypothetical protein